MTDQPIIKSSPFRPKAIIQERARRNIKIELEPATYIDVKDRAAKAGISMKDYLRQALDYAMSREEVK